MKEATNAFKLQEYMEETTIAYHQIIGGTATLAPEGIEANYRDMLNYGVFALIRLNHLD